MTRPSKMTKLLPAPKWNDLTPLRGPGMVEARTLSWNFYLANDSTLTWFAKIFTQNKG